MGGRVVNLNGEMGGGGGLFNLNVEMGGRVFNLNGEMGGGYLI